MSDPLLCAIDNGVAVLTFNRPDAANTWSADLHVAYLQALRDLAVDERARVVVVTGAGRHFCAGADVSLLDTIQNGGELPPELSSESFLEPIDFPKPLIAAVNGSAAGLGFVHALLCDIRIASDRALFTTSFAQRGLVAEHGVSWLLPQVVGRGHALDLLLSSRRVGAEEAARIGLVHRVVPADDLLDEALRYARELVENCSPGAMKAIKHQVARHSTLQLREAENETVVLVDESLDGADFKEGVRSFIERRPARFAPLGQGTVFPSLGHRDVDPADVAERFFAATSANDWAAAVALLSPDARLATHPGPPESGFEGVAEGWQKLRDAVGPWEYSDVRRMVSGNSFCEQHRVRFTELDVELEVCVVASLDATGKIVRLEEYADGQALRAAVQRRRSEVEVVR